MDDLQDWLMRLAGVDNDDTKYAKTALSFVKSDGSTGFHNFPYAQDILNAGIDKVDDYTIIYLPTMLQEE